MEKSGRSFGSGSTAGSKDDDGQKGPRVPIGASFSNAGQSHVMRGKMMMMMLMISASQNHCFITYVKLKLT